MPWERSTGPVRSHTHTAPLSALASSETSRSRTGSPRAANRSESTAASPSGSSVVTSGVQHSPPPVEQRQFLDRHAALSHGRLRVRPMAPDPLTFINGFVQW